MLRTALIALSAALAASAASAAGIVATQVVETEVVVVDDKGAERLVRRPAEKVKPGEAVIYTLQYKNPAPTPADAMVLVMPVPKEVTYVEGSVAGENASVTFSADGGATYVARGRLTVSEEGKARPATNGDITHVKWAFVEPVAAKGEGEVSFRGVLK